MAQGHKTGATCGNQTHCIYLSNSDVWVALRLSVQKIKSADQVQIPDLAVRLTLC